MKHSNVIVNFLELQLMYPQILATKIMVLQIAGMEIIFLIINSKHRTLNKK